MNESFTAPDAVNDPFMTFGVVARLTCAGLVRRSLAG